MKRPCEKVVIQGKEIGCDGRVFVIAEIGCNFEGDMERAREMIQAAAQAGADAVKFQTFIAEKLASRYAEKFWEIDGCPGSNQLEEFQQMPRLNPEQYAKLQQEAEVSGIIFFSTPCDEDSADMLESLGVPAYKISSMDITHLPFLEHVARKGKPMLISTGASTTEEIREAVKTVVGQNNKRLALLHCISNYPTKVENVNLRMITCLKNEFPGIPIGYSDHTLPQCSEAVIAGAVSLGATIIEKHFTFDSSRPGYDHAISADYSGLKRIVEAVRDVEKSLGEEQKKPEGSEAKARIHARRSVVASRAIRRGELITRDMLEIKRPGTGLAPKSVNEVIGKKAARDILPDEALSWDMLS